jgi:hypothetical protein
MSMVKVWNDNHLDYTEPFEDYHISIKAGHFITMDEEKAIKFKGQYRPIIKDGGGVQKPESYKMIRIEPIGKQELKTIDSHRCQGCSFIGKDKKDLDAHITEMHLDQILDKDEYKKRLAGK